MVLGTRMNWEGEQGFQIIVTLPTSLRGMHPYTVVHSCQNSPHGMISLYMSLYVHYASGRGKRVEEEKRKEDKRKKITIKYKQQLT